MVGHTQIPAIPSSSFPICICRRQIAAPPPPEISPPAVHPQTDPSVAGCCKSGSKQSRSLAGGDNAEASRRQRQLNSAPAFCEVEVYNLAICTTKFCEC
uniref:Uncharacterized protein n=1 Tax=Leersia perrieri TaxID=77586 RepID=A0A0D9X7H1_9ORYZ